MIRCRMTYQKTEALRYTGNLDLQKIWERFLRRADLPVAYSQGFHPQPRIQQAAPLPLGFLSRAELADIYLDDDSLAPSDVVESLEVMTSESGPALKMMLAARQSATGRPEEVLAALGFSPFDARYTRTRIILAD